MKHLKKYSVTATGSCILLYKEQESNNPYPLKFEMVGWRGTMSLRAYVPIHDAIHYLRLLGADCSKFGEFLFLYLFLINVGLFIIRFLLFREK